MQRAVVPLWCARRHSADLNLRRSRGADALPDEDVLEDLHERLGQLAVKIGAAIAHRGDQVGITRHELGQALLARQLERAQVDADRRHLVRCEVEVEATPHATDRPGVAVGDRHACIGEQL
jgi:hypothetical protein